MYCLINFCCICFHNKEHLHHLSDLDSENITYFIKLTSCVPEMYFKEMNEQRFVCNKCCETIDAAYKFRQRCLKSKTMLKDYILQIQKVTNISGTANVYLTDINKFDDIKKQYQKENNIDKTKLCKNVDEDANEIENSVIKRESNSISSKLIDNHNHIKLENLEINMKQENPNFDEQVEENFDNIFVNQNELDISQNKMNLIATTIKTENENQDIEEHLKENYENILEYCDRENNGIVIKVEENHDYSLNLEKCSDCLLKSPEKIIIDNIDNDFESVKCEINVQYKSEFIEEVSKEEYFIPLNYLENCSENPSKHVDIKTGIIDNDTEAMNYEINILCKTEDIEDVSKEDNVIPWINQSEYKTDKDNPLQNLDEMKIDILDNDIDSMKYNTNLLCKTEDIEEDSQEDHVIPLIDQGVDIDTDATSWFSTMKQTSKNKLLKLQDINNRKVKKISHKRRKHLECNICKKQFNVSSNLRYHMVLHTGTKPHECSVCQHKFAHSSNLREHMRCHTGERPYECTECHQKFARLSTLKNHMIIHTREKPHKCDVCQQKFTRLSTLKNHIKAHIGVEPYECSVCKMKFDNLSNLTSHLLIHTGEKPYECSVCMKKFSKLYNLTAHRKIHTGEKAHECRVCQQRFTHLSTLKNHVKTHTGEKLHECSVCQKKFSRWSFAIDHMRTHSGDKRHECSVCLKKFTRLASVKRHMRIHTEEKSHALSVSAFGYLAT